MTKAQIQTLINTNLADASSITASEHRAVENALVEQLYSNSTLQEITSGAITCKLYYKRTGNTCTVTGFIRNGNPYMISNTTLITIPNANFFAKSLQETQDLITNDITYSIGLVSISHNVIYLLGNLGGGSRVRINATYQTND
jgi:hypothetical protein